MSNKEWDKISYQQSVDASESLNLNKITEEDMEILKQKNRKQHNEEKCACGKNLHVCTCKNKKY